jgi:hypothetical protein
LFHQFAVGLFISIITVQSVHIPSCAEQAYQH